MGLCRQGSFPKAARPEGALELPARPCHPVHALVYAFWPCTTGHGFRVRIINSALTPCTVGPLAPGQGGYQQPVGHWSVYPPTMPLIRHAIAVRIVIAWLLTTTGKPGASSSSFTPYSWPEPMLVDTHRSHVQPCSWQEGHIAPQMSASGQMAAHGKHCLLSLAVPSTYQFLQAPAAEWIREHCCHPADLQLSSMSDRPHC